MYNFMYNSFCTYSKRRDAFNIRKMLEANFLILETCTVFNFDNLITTIHFTDCQSWEREMYKIKITHYVNLKLCTMT